MLHEKCNLIHDLLGMRDNSNIYLDKFSCFAISRICGVYHVCTHVRNVTTWYLENHLIMRRDNCPMKTANNRALISCCTCKWIDPVLAIEKEIRFSPKKMSFLDASTNYDFGMSKLYI